MAEPIKTTTSAQRALAAEALEVVDTLKADIEELRSNLRKARREVVRLRDELAELRVIRDDAEMFRDAVKKALRAAQT